jgi:hypothetical protein
MCNSDRRHFLAMSMVTLAAVTGAAGLAGAAMAAETPPKKVYVCPPCGCAADGKEFPEPGNCPECGMPLVEKKPEAAPKLSSSGGRATPGQLARQDRAPPPRSAWTGQRGKAPPPFMM